MKMFCQALFDLLFGFVISWGKKIDKNAALKMLLKLAPVVSFINILEAAFGPIFLHQKKYKAKL